MMYQEKADGFWNWFTKHEEDFRKGIEAHESEAVNTQIKEKLQELLPEVVFEITKQDSRFLVELMPMGNALNRVMMLSLILCKPNTLKYWEFRNYRTAKMGSMKINNITLSGDAVTVIPIYDKKQNRFKLKVLCEVLQQFSDEDKFSIMYLLLYEYIGEILTESLISQVEFITSFSYKVRYRQQEQLPLSKLRSWLGSVIGSEKIKQAEQDGLIYEYFSGKPKVTVKKPRYDIVKGYTAFMDMISEYYEEEQPILNYLKEQGFQAEYLYVNTKDEKKLQDILMAVKSVLHSSGVILGVCEALDGTYIDVLKITDNDVAASLMKSFPDFKITVYSF